MAATSRAPARGPINVAAGMGRWSARHRKVAIFGWLAFVVVAFVLGGLVGTKSLSDAAGTPGEAGRAAKLYVEGGLGRGDPESVLVQSRTLAASDPAFRSTVRDLERTLARQSGVSELRSPYEGRRDRISRDGHSALVQFRVGAAQGRAAGIERILQAVKRVARAHPGLYVGEYGDASASKAIDNSTGRDFHRAEILSIPLTLAILLFTFGALIAAGIPLLLALTAVIAAVGLLAFPSQIWPADDAADSVILLIGLAVGVDYSLFYIRREREERALGKGSEAALEAAAATSGRAVLLSGITVLIAMAGMFLTGEKELASVGVGAMLVVATAVAGSVTVLPALLSWLGDRIERGRIPLLGRRRRGESRFFGAVVDSCRPPPAALARPCGRAPPDARRAGVRTAHEQRGRDGASAAPRDREDVRADPARLWRAAARVRRGQGTGRRCRFRAACRGRAAPPRTRLAPAAEPGLGPR
jgi:uncharacterized membrane protein YdfJ with MMPL/SSD domain